MNLTDLYHIDVPFNECPKSTQQLLRKMLHSRLLVYNGKWDNNTGPIDPCKMYRLRPAELRCGGDSGSAYGAIYKCNGLHYVATEYNTFLVQYTVESCFFLGVSKINWHKGAELVGFVKKPNFDFSGPFGKLSLCSKGFLRCLKFCWLEVRANGEWEPMIRSLQPYLEYRIKQSYNFVHDDTAEGYVYRSGMDYYMTIGGEIFEVTRLSKDHYDIGSKVEMPMEEWLSKKLIYYNGVNYANA